MIASCDRSEPSRCGDKRGIGSGPQAGIPPRRRGCRTADGAPRWMTHVLLLAGLYNLLWGTVQVLRPDLFFRLFELPPINYPAIWQCLGMVLAVYGVGYLIAAFSPFRHWPIVLVGLLGKTFGPIGFLISAAQGQLPWSLGWSIVTNDLIWWVPFGLILWQAAGQDAPDAARDDSSGLDGNWQTAVQQMRTDHGTRLSDVTQRQPTMFVFLRHLGCTFAREALADLAAGRAIVASHHVALVVVHPESRPPDVEVLQHADVHVVTDPAQRLYRAFGVKLGTPYQLFSPNVIWRGLRVALWQGHGFALPQADLRRMPGLFVVYQDRILAQYSFRTAADRPNYAALAQDAVRQLQTSS